MLRTKPSSAVNRLVFTLSSGKGERKKSPESCKSCLIPEGVGKVLLSGIRDRKVGRTRAIISCLAAR